MMVKSSKIILYNLRMEDKQQMSLIEEILSVENMNEAIKKVKSNKGASGIDKMTVDQIDAYFNEHRENIINKIMNKSYKPQPVRRVYIPKSNDKLKILGIATVVDMAINKLLYKSYHQYMKTYSVIIHLSLEQVGTVIRQ